MAVRYRLRLVIPLAVQSHVRGDLTLRLKQGGPPLEMSCRIFERVDPSERAAWIDSEPCGQCARRVGFLIECLTGQTLPVKARIAGTDAGALGSRKLVAASPEPSVPNRRLRVPDKVSGTPAFCPFFQAVGRAFTVWRVHSNTG